MKILVVGSHPDDEVLGCGGTILKHINTGDKVSVLILGEGITSRDNVRNARKRGKELDDLKTKTKEVKELLGISNGYIEDFPDNRFDTVPLLDIVKTVEEYKNNIQPDIIYTHWQYDLNIDHRITYQAVITATRPMENETVKEIYSFEVPSSSEWNFGSTFNPNVFVDISGYIGEKIVAMEIYKSEIREFPHPRSEKAIRATATKWGSVSGFNSAEAFILIRRIR